MLKIGNGSTGPTYGGAAFASEPQWRANERSLLSA